MKSNYFYLLSVTVTLSMASADSVATNPILDALVQDSGATQLMTEHQMSMARGSALQRIENIASPSVTMGIKEHHVTYKKFGNYGDYMSYRYIGFSYNPQEKASINVNGTSQNVVGDLWLADRYSSAYAWNRVNSQAIEYHLQGVTESGQIRPFGYRITGWNRPISRFSW